MYNQELSRGIHFCNHAASVLRVMEAAWPAETMVSQHKRPWP